MIPLLLALTGCYSPPEMAPLADAPRQVAAAAASARSLAAQEAFSPSDLLPLASGGLAVADGYRGRVLILDGEAVTPLADPERFGRPARLSPAEGGLWVVPVEGDTLLRIDAAGMTMEQLDLPAPEGGEAWSPLDVLELGGALIVSDRQGRLAWLDRSSGAVNRTLTTDDEGGPLGLLVDLAPAAGGGFWATDAGGGRSLRFSADGALEGRVGRFGHWVGTLTRPAASAEAPGGALLVADEAQGAVQVFSRDGAALGPLVGPDGALGLSRPVAVRSQGEQIWVLDAEGPTLWTLTLDAAEVARAEQAAAVRALRQPLGELVDAGDPVTCRRCHDGIFQDGREVWDTALTRHPVDVVPEREIPEFFPLDDKGQLVCATCHSPHGTSDLEEIRSVESEGGREGVARDRDSGRESFTRAPRGDDTLCLGCHGDQVHQDAAAVLDFAGTAHPAGDALRQALADRGGELPEVEGACLSCHAVHGAVGESLLRPDTDGQVCLACHPDQADTSRNHPVGPEIHGEGFGLDGEAGLTCLGCHTLVGGRGEALLAEPVERGLLCGACHEQRQVLSGGAHRQVEGMLGAPCLSCHDLHGGHRGVKMLRIVAAASEGDPEGCATCHEGMAHPEGHPVDGRAFGEGESLVCSSCHNPHQPAAGDAEGCLSCHSEQAEAHARGGHGSASCLDCHPPHEAPPAGPAIGELNPRSLTCLACHGEGAQGATSEVLAWDHPAPVFDLSGARWEPLTGLPLFAADGAQLPEGENGELTCASCHLTHGPDASEPGDSLRRPGWKPVCSSCHGEDALLLYRYFHQPKRREGM